MGSLVRRFSAAAERNRGPLLEVLRETLPPAGRALEIASGSGQHVAWFARHLPGWRWQPSDADAQALPSIAAWCAEGGGAPGDAEGPPGGTIDPPLHLDVLASPWPVEGLFDAIVCANMLHIAPWACCAALMQGAARHLAPDGVLVTYGPFVVEGEPLAPSNAAFDTDLRTRNPAWGLRSLGQVLEQARAAGLRLRRRVAMPANNQTLIFEREDDR